jgi:UDP-3-O-[3-hydroxymyristoyl] glucosamine N-acyltransferase
MSHASVIYTLGQLAQLLELECRGDTARKITGLATLSSASEGKLGFLANPRYQNDLRSTSASAVILAAEMADDCPVDCLISTNPYLSFAKATALFNTATSQKSGIAASAVISTSATVGVDVSIGANAVIGEGVVIGDNTVIGAGSVIGDNSKVGKDCLLHANVTICHGVSIGDRVILHSGSVLGSDGFGFSPAPKEQREQGKGWIKIHQLGGVVVGNDVEVGANTVIDRGALDNTTIGNGVIIDNLVQIAHNVVIGDNTAIAGCTGIAGSTEIGSNCTIAGCVIINGHITIAEGTHITGGTIVTKSITKAGSYSSGSLVLQESRSWRRNAVRASQLDDMYKRLVELEKKFKQ